MLDMIDNLFFAIFLLCSIPVKVSLPCVMVYGSLVHIMIIIQLEEKIFQWSIAYMLLSRALSGHFQHLNDKMYMM